MMMNRRSLLASAALAPVLASPFAASTRVAAEDNVTVEKDVPYGEVAGEMLLLDIYRPPAREEPRPAVVVIHGGGWSDGDRLDMAVAARELAGAGYVAFAISYRLFNAFLKFNVWPTQLDDVQRAVRWVRAHAADYGLDPERVAAYGYSAGAHLAAMLGVRDTRDNADPDLAAYASRVDAVVSLSADLDLTASLEAPGFDGVLKGFLGGSIEEQPAAYQDASPLTWVDAESAPFLIVHGGLDDAILAEQSQRMVAALTGAEVDVVYAVMPEAGHGGIGQWSGVGPLALAFLEMRLHPAI
jgi:acetyl esterase/lipase